MDAYVRRTLGSAGPHLRVPGRVSELSALGALVRTRRSIRRFEPDVVHLQDAVLTDPRLIALAGARPRQFALTVHDPARHPGGNHRRLRFETVRRALVSSAGLIFVHAEALREELLHLHRPRAPVVVVPHGVQGSSFSPLPAEPSVLFFGRIMAYKGLDILLDAMPMVWERAPSVRATIAGEGQLPDHPVLKDPRVAVLPGHVPDEAVPGLYRGATCVVLPYRQASQSGVGSLAKQYGRAMVATSVGGLPELVPPGAGSIVPPEDPAALSDAILALATRTDLAESMGRAAAAAAAGAASWDQVGTLTLEAYARHLRPGRR